MYDAQRILLLTVYDNAQCVCTELPQVTVTGGQYHTHKILTKHSSGNRLRGLWLKIFIIYIRRSGFSNELETSLKIAQNFLIVHELIKATFEDLFIFSFDYFLRQVILDVNDSMRETILPSIKRAPILKSLRECLLVTLFFLKRMILTCIWVVLLCENLEYFHEITPEPSIF